MPNTINNLKARDVAFFSVALHVNRGVGPTQPDACSGPGFYHQVFPLRFELSVPKGDDDEDWFGSLTFYLSSNSERPGRCRCQKLVSGKRFFTYTAEDYFSEDST